MSGSEGNDEGRSLELLQRARKTIPGGVNSPVRAFKGVGGTPRFVRSARGAFLEDVDGRELLDYIGSWGVMVLGHAHPAVNRALAAAVERGTSFGTSSPKPSSRRSPAWTSCVSSIPGRKPP